MQVLDQKSISGKIPILKKGLWSKELREKKIWISDYGEDSPEIELLIGADFCGQIFTGLTHKLECGLIAYDTYLGWVLMGRISNNIKGSSQSSATQSIAMLTHSEKIEHFWDLELLGIKDPIEKTSREEEVVEFFNNTLSIDFDGRYMVRLPWTDNSSLPDNKNIAEKRLLATTSKLISSGRYSDCNSVLESWENENIIEEVLEGGKEGRCHYLSHRGVFKECSTTKLRPVFDAASKEKNKFSLNDCLEKGLNVLDTIPSILMRFREKEIGVISDIKKAFLQISIHPEDRDFLRFFWWKDYEERKMKIYRHRRLVFGLNCSPFLLGAVINNLLENCLQQYRIIGEILKKYFYVDNCVTSVDTEELSELVNGVTELMKLGSFEHRGWENTSKDAESVPSYVLGLLWERRENLLFCDTSHIALPVSLCPEGMCYLASKRFLIPLDSHAQ